jgi:hypothetical protein
MQCVRRLSGGRGLEYAALEPSCRSLYIASEKPFQFDSDLENAVQKNVPEKSKLKGTVKLKITSQFEDQDYFTVWRLLI